MKLFGNTGTRGVSRAKPSRDSAHTAAAQPAAVAVAERDRPAAQPGSRFRRGYLIYVVAALVLIAAGCALLWARMDVYERSRPARAVAAWMDGRTPSDWRSALTALGVDDAFVDTLALDRAESYKKLSEYTDETPVFTVAFGARPMLTVALSPGEALAFGSHGWEIGSVTPVASGLAVFVPPGATVTVDGAAVGAEKLTRRDAQKLTLGELELEREDIPGLDEYRLDDVYTIERVAVADAEGTPLAAAYTAGSAYYYPPLTSDWRIVAPSSAAVSVNGVALSADNARSETLPARDDAYEIFEGIEDALPFRFDVLTTTAWTVEQLVAPPEVTAVMPDGTALTPLPQGSTVTFDAPRAGVPDPALQSELEDYILEVFDAHIAYQGNRNLRFESNYARYIAYLVPNSEAWDQTYRARGSVEWAKGQNTHPDPTLTEVLRYDPDCFTAQVDFTPEGDPDGAVRTNIYVFVRYNGAWRVIRILNR